VPVRIDCPESQGSGLCPKCGLPLAHHRIPFDVIHDDPLCYQVVVLKSDKHHLLIHMSQSVYRDKFTENLSKL
jgi:hypothetical protein